jgi:membrane protease YdiL (CAAX protease family)
MGDPESIQEYIDSLRSLPLAHLEWMAENIDQEKFPERYKAVLDEISEKRLHPPAEVTPSQQDWIVRTVSILSKIYLVLGVLALVGLVVRLAIGKDVNFKIVVVIFLCVLSYASLRIREKCVVFRGKWSVIELENNLKKATWSFRETSVGILILILFCLIPYFHFFRYKPWIGLPLNFALFCGGELCLALYSFHIFWKYRFSPSIRPSYPSIVMEAVELLSLSFPLVISCAVIVGVLAKISGTRIEPSHWVWFPAVIPNKTLVLIILLLAFTLGPVAEEIFFRGFIYSWLRTRFSIFLAISFQAVAFSLVHRGGLLESVYYFLIGIAFAIIYEKRKELLSPIIVHAMLNAIVTIPLVVLTLQNYHTPARNWMEASVKPSWFEANPPQEVERQENGIKQWQYAIDKWGSKGSKQWKKEVNAFHAVSVWFPNDRTACSKALLGVVTVYVHYLADYRRGIFEADKLLSDFPDQREQCASALSKMGRAYLMLKDFKKSRESFKRVLNEFPEFEEAAESAREGMKWLDALQKDG